MEHAELNRLWDEALDARRSTKLYRTLAVKHPIIKKWLAEEARHSDPAVNPLFFLHRPRWRVHTRMRRLRIINALLWALKAERFQLVLDTRDRVMVLIGWDRAWLSIVEETIGPVLPMTPSRTNLTGRLICHMDAKMLGGIKRQWEDEPTVSLETQMPEILATFAVWAAVTAPARERWWQEQRAAMLHFPKTD
jgi:hypothetical protein